jgi:hypothetical protein
MKATVFAGELIFKNLLNYFEASHAKLANAAEF